MAEQTYRELLLPHARVLTPNVMEAEVLLGRRITTLAEQHEAAAALAALGPAVVVVKGGHAVQGTEEEAVDVVWEDGQVYELRAPRTSTTNDHGTGCTFAAAVAAQLALGHDVASALRTAKSSVAAAVAGGAGWRLGGGHGPLDHFGWTTLHRSASRLRTASDRRTFP